MQIISFEGKLLSNLISETVLLIHHTKVVNAIKRLVDAHDVLDLALKLEQEFSPHPPWNLATSEHLHDIRCELLARYADAFKPTILLPKYYHNVGRLLTTMDLRGTKR